MGAKLLAHFLLAGGLGALLSVVFLLRSQPSGARSSYECGFDPVSSMREPFSIRFFLVGILFLVFDVEITLFFPLVFGVAKSVVVFFVGVLLLGLAYEKHSGVLKFFFGGSMCVSFKRLL